MAQMGASEREKENEQHSRVLLIFDDQYQFNSIVFSLLIYYDKAIPDRTELHIKHQKTRKS